MSNRHRHYRPRGRGTGAEPSVHPHSPTPYLQNPNPSPSFYQQNPNPSSFQSASFPFVPNSPALGVGFPSHLQFSHGAYQQQQLQFPHGVFQQQLQFPHDGFQQQLQPAHGGFQPQRPDEVLQKVEQAVSKAHRNLIATKESVSAWKVAQSALLTLQVDSLSSLGLQFQDVPSLHKLIVTEGKVNSFMHCFVGVRRITSLYDLNIAICKSEGVDHFEELGLGSLLRHPLVGHYFSTPLDATEVFEITSEEIICHLSNFMDICTEKDIRVESFLDFLTKKQSVATPKKLGVRIQSLGMHIKFIQEAKKSEKATLEKYLQSMKQSFLEQTSKVLGSSVLQHPNIRLQKKKMDKKFNAISERIKSFSSVNKDFRPKHIKFISSSSEDENDGVDVQDEDSDGSNLSGQGGNSSQDRKKVAQCGISSSSCPYPSAAEEMERLGLKAEIDCHASYASVDLWCDESKNSSGKKRKCENQDDNNKNKKFFNSSKEKKRNQRSQHCPESSKTLNEHSDPEKVGDLTLTRKALEKFITTWKEACRDHSVAQVFDRMLKFYKVTPQKKEKSQSIFSAYPGVGLLNVAVTSIKYGMWDSLYDTFQTIGEHGFICPNSAVATEMIDVGPSVKKDMASNSQDCIPKPQNIVTVDDIIRKVGAYFEIDPTKPSESKLPPENPFQLFKKFWDCELWLTKQLSVQEFSSLGYGKFIEFLEKNASLLPCKWFEGLTGHARGNSSLEVSMLQNELLVFLSQAANDVRENSIITKEQVGMLLQRQFPLISFQIKGNDPQGYFQNLIKKQRNCVSSTYVLFSIALLGTCFVGGPSLPNEKLSSETDGMVTDLCPRAGFLGSMSGRDAIDCLLKAPMLSDLHTWSHWDLVFAPSLGSLLEWLLLNEFNTEELTCIVTRDGKLIRIDRSATINSFLEAALQGFPFQTAVQLLSVLALYGGTSHAPVSLLKCHASRAIQVIAKNSMDCMEVTNNDGRHSVDFRGVEINELSEGLCQINRAAGVAAKFVLDCLVHLPSEFRSFATDVLLSGLQSLTMDAPSAMLNACDHADQRVVLHDIGFSLGILDWVEDYRIFSSVTTDETFLISCNPTKKRETLSPEFGIDSDGKINEPQSGLLDDHQESFNEGNKCKISVQESCDCHFSPVLKDNEDRDATLLIESIRREEFGLDPSLECAESNLLKKQHARLGRALHCLSQELYSHDSHFLLELVQNADDNIFSENVEPTLVFILQAAGIVVLNNEQGFSAQNIRALCDVGNSTKKGSNSGYIGQKGIGFKSVFRVTDAPEIHSNGFHVKFDISEGEIGFILPTLVPPCDVDLFRRHLCTTDDQTDTGSWNTCILLPFKSKLKGVAIGTIMSMFSDLHPSLLLFLHRLRCIKFRNMLDDSVVVLRKETVGNGIIKVSHGKSSTNWLVASQELQASTIRPDVQTTEISIAFTLRESGNREYTSHLEQQPVFAFLPLRMYGLKFILQGDFILPSSREEVDGDSAWNQWLLSEFPGLFISAERSFCALPCFLENPGKAVTVYMSFVPLPGEVHGFFSRLPHMIISKLRTSNCFVLEGKSTEWVPPCSVLRGWDERARVLLPESLLRHHLGLSYLNRNIVLSDPLAKALGVQEYGPKILIEIMMCICSENDGLDSLGLSWLSSWLIALYDTLSVRSEGPQTYFTAGEELDHINNLRKISFIPLSDGSYSSLDEGPIWLPCDAFTAGLEGERITKVFPMLYAKLRTVNPGLLSAKTLDPCSGEEIRPGTLLQMLRQIGVQQLSAHEVIRTYILPALSFDGLTDKHLMTEYLSFVMHHLNSNCTSCRNGRADIISELQNKAIVLTNHGYKRPIEEPIHFGKEFGNTIDIHKLVRDTDAKWNEVDTIYLEHPITHSFSVGVAKWREFFQELGVTDFVQIICVEKDMVDRDLGSTGWVLTDWESPELLHLLSVISLRKDRDKCEYLLEVLDKLWDDCFCAKLESYCSSKSTNDKRPVESSFMKAIREFKWVVSSVDNELHYPKDLFYNCEAVRSILGPSAPYAVPQVRSKRFLADIGFKIEVTLDDALSCLRSWRTSNSHFRASIAQMSRFYSFIADAIATAKGKFAEEFRLEPCIFVPLTGIVSHEEPLSGIFLSSSKVYWQDPTGCADRARDLILHRAAINEITCTSGKILSHIYPSLQSFFINECAVQDFPPFSDYLQILQEISSIALPSQTADVVLRAFLKWANDIKSRLVEPDEISQLKESLHRLESTVLPTVQDKWVSLHPSFGLVCWCDDEELRNQFESSDNINFLHLGNLSEEAKQTLPMQIGMLMRTIGVSALSEIVSREAIFSGYADSGEMTSLVDWALSHAQRYLHELHPETYFHLKQSGFEKLSKLQVVVVEDLFYQHTIKGYGSSKKQFKCSCLLQGNILYVIQVSDSHSIFMELSRLFFNGSAELHLANFLHMITTMEESGFAEEQIESFIAGTQKLPKLPNEEPVWSLSCLPSLHYKNENSLPSSLLLPPDQNTKKREQKPGIGSSWPPVDWKTAPGFNFARSNIFQAQPNCDVPHQEYDYSKAATCTEGNSMLTVDIDGDWIIEDESEATRTLTLMVSSSNATQDKNRPNQSNKSKGSEEQKTVVRLEAERLHLGTQSQNPNKRKIGRLGELIAYRYFVERFGQESVKWVNEVTETGAPFDLIIGLKGKKWEYVEVKATSSVDKDWFEISTREWEFAINKGNSFSILHVALDGEKHAKLMILKNPVYLCNQNTLQLAILMLRQPDSDEFSVT